MNAVIRKYLAEIGRRGGRVSRRQLNSQAAKGMVKVREARRAYNRFYAQCFWSFSPKLRIKAPDVPWVAEQLMKHGGREAWLTAGKLCR